ncbi:MAG: tail fiber protein [Saprospiraceae bacterium]|nr:tail fiber protein [Saprospiraceae bacterium]MDZ4706200.1 tail fiber protein [Saprospiraceae bacterium]
MAEPFLSEIRLFSFNFAPQGWALCNGQLLPINQNQALFALLGTTYGGDGRVNFALPDFRGRVPFHMGNGHTLGERGGEQANTLSIATLPVHTHVVRATSSGSDTVAPSNTYYADSAPSEFYAGAGNIAMAPETLTSVGGSQAHLNMQPSLVITFGIALQGIFPSQN